MCKRGGVVTGLLKRTCSGDTDALNLIDEAEKEAPAVFHGNRYTSSAVSNIHSTSRPAGTTRQRALRMLRTGRPDLHACVITGECLQCGVWRVRLVVLLFQVFPEIPEKPDSLQRRLIVHKCASC